MIPGARVLLPLLLAVAAAPAFADLQLATSKNCLSCHAVEHKVLGPSFKSIAARYASQPNAADTLAGKILRGSTGAWGPNPMPPNTQVTEPEARKLAGWVLTLR